MIRRLSLALAVCSALAAAAAAQQPVDTAYTRQIRASTSEPRFNTDLTDYLPADPRIPTPLAVLGYVPGTVGRLSRVADINRYFRALAAASPRIRIFSIGMSDEGREMIAAAVRGLGDHREPGDVPRDHAPARRPARPSRSASARRLIGRGKPIYWLTGSIHSPETGSPEMLMELAYRLAVDERPDVPQASART